MASLSPRRHGGSNRSLISCIAAACAVPLLVSAAHAATCSAGDFAKVFDESGKSLRAFALATQPKLQERMRAYRDAKKLTDENYEDAALDAIQDSTLAGLDEKSSTLLESVHANGRIPEGGAPDCTKLDTITVQARDLLDVMRQKSDYMLARLDAKIAEAGGGPASHKEAATKPAPISAPPEKTVVAKAETAKPEPVKPEPAKKPEAEKKVPEKTWSSNTKPDDAFIPPATETAPVPTPLPAPLPVSGDGYSIDEIRDATRGFFGTISTNLASVIEYAFKTTGRPSAYVLGTEGGGAFLAGLRFGQGTLYMRNQPGTRPVFWHGPSVGTDFGASGSRTIFLIYKMQQPDALFRSYAGVDGSAYLVGGVGITFLKGGDVLMAPIRSGLGLRVGANIGYLRFTETQTWNPF